MKAIYVFLFACFFICPVQAQIKSDSLHVEMWKLTDLISQYDRNPTPELKAYFRSLRPVADEYWKTTVDSIDCSMGAMKTYDKYSKFIASGVDVGMITGYYDKLLEAVIYSYKDTILNNPQIQAFMERGREVIRKGGDIDQAWKIVGQGLYTLPRYQHLGQSDDPDVRRLDYEFLVLSNVMLKWCIYEFGRMVREREGLIHRMTIIRDSIWIKE